MADLLDEATRAKLEQEVLYGNKAKKAYKLFVKDFIDAKRKQLYETFKTVELTNEQDLIAIKRLDLALSSLEAEIQSAIDTGRMASISLGNDSVGENDEE